MSRLRLLALPLVALACAEPVSAPLTAPVTVVDARDHGTPRNFQTHLTGDEEVPPRETLAQGNAKFQLSKDGESLEYRLIVANIENVVQAHIHVGAAGTNGPVVAFLYGPVAPGGGRIDGVIAEGVITASSLRGRLAGQPLSRLVEAIEAGNTYVNVHTSNGTATPAPGNFPGGEVRGQIDHGNGM